MGFDWDEAKRRLNIKKHGIDFEDAAAAFDAPMLSSLDTREDYGEDRWVGLGIVRNVVMVIVLRKGSLTQSGFSQRERRQNMKEKRTTKKSRTDWDKLSKMKDSEIDTSDIPILNKDFFKRAVIQMPKNKKLVSIRLDEDVLSWFKKQGKGYQTKINEILKLYMRAKAA